VQFLLLHGKRITAMDSRKEMIKTESHKPLVDEFQLLGIS
jgi:hypothetical protein